MVNFRVQATVEGSFKDPRFLEKVYVYADEDRGFYINRDNFIAYKEERLILNIAFHSLYEAFDFLAHVNDIGKVRLRAQISVDSCSYDYEIYYDDYLDLEVLGGHDAHHLVQCRKNIRP